jgi:hypothetical protein
MQGTYQSEAEWWFKADMLEAYQDTIGFRILSVTTNSDSNLYVQDKFFYAWHSALLFGHEATGWGEYLFSSNNASAPFHTRPVVSPGSMFISQVVNSSPLFYRDTDAGRIRINTATHSYGFDSSVAGVRQEDSSNPKSVRLRQNFPNPFNPVTTIRFDLSSGGHVLLEIINMVGQEVVTLVDEVREAGGHSVQFNAGGLASGVYFYRLTSEVEGSTGRTQTETRGMIVTK